MKNCCFACYALVILVLVSCSVKPDNNQFPDGTPISDWFSDTTRIDLASLGTQYNISDYGAVADDSTLNTTAIQQCIDNAAANGGGVIVIPQGTFQSGALFFKPNTHLHLLEGAMLKGSNDINQYPIQPSRMEGQNLDYYPALVNAYGVNGFSISGKGTIDGNGLKYWEAFWQRRDENPKCTNLEVSRPRLVFIWNSNNVHIEDVKLQNSGFWTTHFYKCDSIKVLNAYIFAPREPVKSPSSDAIDLDVCNNVLIKNCYLSVNDDAIAIKGGKGPWADEDPNNGSNNNILIEDCAYGFCHSMLTCGSESVHTNNVLLRNCTSDGASRLIFLKMRPDTPQLYENITVENITGTVRKGIYVRPWKQFFDLQGRETPPVSICRNITFKNIEIQCEKIFEIEPSENDKLENFTFKDFKVRSEQVELNKAAFNGLKIENVVINGEIFD